MNALAAALFTKLDTDRQSGGAGTLHALGVTGVYENLAPRESTAPYIIFQKQAGTDVYHFRGRAWRNFLYTIKGVTQIDSSKLGGQIAEHLDALLTDSGLAVTGYGTMLIQRESDVDYVDGLAGGRYNHIGAMFRILVQPA